MMESTNPITSKDVDPKTELARSQYATVHVDKAMMAIDHGINTATITLLQMHAVPLPRPDEWGIESIVWDIVGEIKMPLAALNALLDYYVRVVSNGLQLMPLIQKHLQEHPYPQTKRGGVSYGPTAFKGHRKEETEQEKPSETGGKYA